MAAHAALKFAALSALVAKSLEYVPAPLNVR
jgi:hypothetical protein